MSVHAYESIFRLLADIVVCSSWYVVARFGWTGIVFRKDHAASKRKQERNTYCCLSYASYLPARTINGLVEPDSSSGRIWLIEEVFEVEERRYMP